MRDFIRRLMLVGTIIICISQGFVAVHYNADEKTGETEHWIWPTGGEITDTYGTRHGTHKGIDIAAEQKTPVYAVDAGVVSKSYYSDTYGNVIFIKHQNNYETVYAHLYKRNVFEGQKIQQGELIGRMGNTGDSSGVHLHFEVHQDMWTYSKENAIDPEKTLGATEIGQVVYAQSQVNLNGSIETAGHLHNDSEKEEPTTDSAVKDVGIYVVQSGDTLWSIAQKHNLSVDNLIQLNKLTEDGQIMIGQELVVSKDTQTKYMVVQGDTLITISKKTGKTVSELKKWNNLKTDIIFPKQVLTIE